MKLLNRFKSILLGIRQSLRRFPITIGISTILAISLIYFHENRLIISALVREDLMRFNMVLGMALLLSLCLDLLKENFYKNDKFKTLISYLLGAGILVFYYLFLLKDFQFVSITRYVGIIIFLILVYFFVPVIGNNDKNYEYRVIEIFGNFFETVIYSLVLLLGIFAIFFTIDNLFDVDIDSKYYYYVFLILFFMFAVSFFLSKQPKDGEFFDEKQYSQSMRILLTYIVIPLITIYTIILYAYFAKILITWEWPKGLVSHLVIWYTALSIGVIFLITPLIETDKISRYFKGLFPKLVLPILLMMFLSIGQRIFQYGITENRYYILVLGIWITLIMIYFSVKKQLKNIIIPISLSILVLNSVIGPFSSYSISKYSQNRRLNAILNRNLMISGDTIIRNKNVSKDDKREINNIIHYFINNHSLDDVKVLSDNFKIADMEDVFGFEYEPNIYGISENNIYFYYGTDLSAESIDIQGYEHFVQLYSWDEKDMVIENLKIDRSLGSRIVTLVRNEEKVMIIDIDNIALEIVDGLDPSFDEGKSQRTPKEMSYEVEENTVRLKIIFTNISGNKDDSNIQIDNIEYILLIDDLNN